MKISNWIFALMFLAAAPTKAAAIKTLSTPHFNEVAVEVENLMAEEGAENVLVVFDIDNTVLETKTDLGSEHWFLWQKDLIGKGTGKTPAVANTVEDLFTVQSWIYSFVPMRPVASEIPATLMMMKSKGAAVIALTSRLLAVHDATVRELERNHLPLSPAKELGLDGVSEPFLPYDVMHPEKDGLTPAMIKEFKLGPARPVMFDRGVLLSQEQHKGAMLLTLLARLTRKYTAIVFVDNRVHHLDGMRAAFADRTEKLATVQYTAKDTAIAAFDRSDKQQVNAEWCALAQGLKEAIFTTANERVFNMCE